MAEYLRRGFNLISNRAGRAVRGLDALRTLPQAERTLELALARYLKPFEEEGPAVGFSHQTGLDVSDPRPFAFNITPDEEFDPPHITVTLTGDYSSQPPEYQPAENGGYVGIVDDALWKTDKVNLGLDRGEWGVVSCEVSDPQKKTTSLHIPLSGNFAALRGQLEALPTRSLLRWRNPSDYQITLYRLAEALTIAELLKEREDAKLELVKQLTRFHIDSSELTLEPRYIAGQSNRTNNEVWKIYTAHRRIDKGWKRGLDALFFPYLKVERFVAGSWSPENQYIIRLSPDVGEVIGVEQLKLSGSLIEIAEPVYAYLRGLLPPKGTSPVALSGQITILNEVAKILQNPFNK